MGLANNDLRIRIERDSPNLESKYKLKPCDEGFVLRNIICGRKEETKGVGDFITF